ERVATRRIDLGDVMRRGFKADGKKRSQRSGAQGMRERTCRVAHGKSPLGKPALYDVDIVRPMPADERSDAISRPVTLAGSASRPAVRQRKGAVSRRPSECYRVMLTEAWAPGAASARRKVTRRR